MKVQQFIQRYFSYANVKANWHRFSVVTRRFLHKAGKSIIAVYGGPWWRRVLMWILTLVLVFVLLLLAVYVNFLGFFGRTPGFADIAQPPVTEASIIFSADSVQIGTYYNENRTPVAYEEISPILMRTLVSTEDVRFYHHHGVDFTALFSATKDIISGHARGASTITQQLAKNLFKVRRVDGKYSTGLLGKIPGIKILIMKAKEWIVAMELETVYSKEEILTMYLNTVDFGSNAYGIKTACSTYFGITPHQLNYQQAATLVGLLKATSTYNPKRNPEKSMERRNVVLENLFKNGQMIINGYPATEKQLDSLKALPIVVAEHIDTRSNLGTVPYFRKALENYVDMLCEKGLIDGYDEDDKIDLYTDGLKIYTTLDTRIQKYAEDAARKQMQTVQRNFDNHWGSTPPWQDASHREIPDFIEDIAKKTTEYKYLVKKYGEGSDSVDFYLNLPHSVTVFSYDGEQEKELSVMDSIRYMVRFMHCGFVAIEPDTRQVKAWVGDVDFNSWEYDKVTAMRQPGSTFKLFVYTEAMNQGLTPCDRRVDEWIAYPDTVDGKPTTWAPHNANGFFTGADMPLKSAFAQSINSIAVKVGLEVGIANVARTAHAMGIESPLKETMSLSLGSSDVNLLELVNAYCTPIDDGKYNMPIMVTRIEDRNGNVIYEPKLKETQAIPYRSAYLMQKMLQAGLTERGGTTAALWQYIHPILNTGTDFGGKTGTTNNHSDAWFVGVTPGLVAGAWVGGEYRSIHFRTGELGQGSRTALPIFGYFVQNLLQDQRFSKYYRKFSDTPREAIDPSCWTCAGYYATPDSLERDTIGYEDSNPSANTVVLSNETNENDAADLSSEEE
ncbi:MAG: transglycosylase domain-containing protein [Prevotellaceae bacterium]|nr:transglycosylase domain-containing protein [Prevotellaceae bacterium]